MAVKRERGSEEAIDREREGKREIGNHHVGDQRPVCLFCLQPSSSAWKRE